MLSFVLFAFACEEAVDVEPHSGHLLTAADCSKHDRNLGSKRSPCLLIQRDPYWRGRSTRGVEGPRHSNVCVCYQQLRREVANFFLHRKSFSKTYFSSRNFPGRLSSTRADILLVLQARKWQINRNFMVFFQSNDESPSHCKKMIKLTLSLWLYSFKIKKN